MQQFQLARTVRRANEQAEQASDVHDGAWGNRSSATMVFLACDDSLGYNGADFVLDNGAAVGTSLEQMLRGAGPYS
jgi:hypothetical protein